MHDTLWVLLANTDFLTLMQVVKASGFNTSKRLLPAEAHLITAALYPTEIMVFEKSALLPLKRIKARSN